MLDQLSNIPLLNLDIVWCFLEVGSLNHLADGDRRLLVAEQGFVKAYGANMERVRDLKIYGFKSQSLKLTVNRNVSLGRPVLIRSHTK